jgi:hypothetical protein
MSSNLSLAFYAAASLDVQRFGAPESHEVLRVLRQMAVTVFHSQINGVAAITATANHPPVLDLQKRVTAHEQVTARDWIPLRTGSVGLPFVGEKFPDVSGHIEQPISVRWIIFDSARGSDSAASVVGAHFVD